MKRVSLCFLALLFVFLPLTSCGTEKGGSPEILHAMIDAAPDGAGILYTTESSAGSPDYLSPELLRELFGDFDFSGVAGAVYLSGGVSLFEISVFGCADSDTAEALAGLCAMRFSNARRTGKSLGLDGVEFSVKIYGNSVLCAMCRNSEDVISAGLEKIKGHKMIFGAKKG